MPGRPEDPHLIPWEACCLHEYLVGRGHWGAEVLGTMPPQPLEGYDELNDHYIYIGAEGALEWIRTPATTPLAEVSDLEAPPRATPCSVPWPLIEGGGLPSGRAPICSWPP